MESDWQMKTVLWEGHRLAVIQILGEKGLEMVA